MGAEIKGLEDIQKNLRKYAKKYPAATANAMYQEGFDIERNATIRAPVEFGRLRASAYTTPPTQNNMVVEVGFGTEYALRQHEGTNFNHPRGGQAKYLENAINQQSAGMANRLADRIKMWVSRGTESFPAPISNTSPVDIGAPKVTRKNKSKARTKKAKAKRQTPKRKK
jgi:hypothetical protein